MEWTPTFALPNLDLATAVGCEYAALVPFQDSRLQALMKLHPKLRKFLSSFTDVFGTKLSPPMLLLKEEGIATSELAAAIAGFRDIVAVASVPLSRARWMVGGAGFHGPHYSDTFAFHPWTIGRDYRYMASSTPAQLALHQVEKFKGQADAHLGVTPLRDYDLDAPLIQALYESWKRRFLGSNPSRPDVALFRSLAMATQAMKVAGGPDAQLYDFGRLTGLWTSAYEILLHPGGRSRVDERTIREHLGKIRWDRSDLNARRHLLSPDGRRVANKEPIRVNLAQLIYFQLSDARNSFLHGNDVKGGLLFMRPQGQSLSNLAAILFRAVVADFIGLEMSEPAPHHSDAEAWGQWYGRRVEFTSPKHKIEDALSIARLPPADFEKPNRKRAIDIRVKGRFLKFRKGTAPPPHKP